MSATTALVPLCAAIVIALLVGPLHRWLAPAVAARSLLVIQLVIVGAALPTIWLLSLGYLAHLSVVHAALAWCGHPFGHHQPITPWLGLPALTIAVLGTGRAIAVLRTYRSMSIASEGATELAEHASPFAYTLPGPGGKVVLSTGLVALLDDAEQSVVLAHEHAHARHRHDRFMLVGRLTTSLLPLLYPLSQRMLFALERWADDAAVESCGDRGFVARTLGKVALQRATPVGALAVGGLGVPGRVAALLGPPPAPPRRFGTSAMWGAVGITMMLALYQLHHVGMLLAALCRH